MTTGRVLVVTNDFPPRHGGIESFVLSLCQGMPADRVVVHTASMPGDDSYDARLPFRVHRDPARVLLPTPAVTGRSIELLRRYRCDRVVLGSSVPLGLMAPRLRAAGGARIVALTHGHEVWWARLPGTRRLLRRVGDSVDTLTYVSGWTRDRIAPALSPAAAAAMARLSPGVDPNRFHPGCGGAAVRRRLGIPADAPVVVSVGRLVARKGQDTLVRAWPAVLAVAPSAVLLVVGDGPRRSRLERLVAERGVTDSVVLAGPAAWEDVPALMDAGDVFALPCRTRRWGLEPEAWGIVFLEAQACGLPVVVGRSGGAPETVTDPAAGVVVTPTVPAVAQALTDLLTAQVPQPTRTPRAAWTWQQASDRLAELLG